MASQNSQLQLYADLVSELLREDPCKIERAKSIRRDVQSVQERTSQEGFGYLTKTLPQLGKALDAALENGVLVVPRGFQLQKNDCRPAFMQAYFNSVFDSFGRLLALESIDVKAIAHLRQVLFACYKLELPYREPEKERVIGQFISDEEALKNTILPDDVVIDTARKIAVNVFKDFNPRDIKPKHGPGAVATGERLEEKWCFSRLYSSLHSVFPYYEYFIVGGARELLDRIQWYKSLTRLEKGRAKVVLVPKDSRGPRLISCEPLEYQWIQQGLGRKLVEHLESSWITKGQINFTSQEINRRLALESSQTREWATLDLKSASDLVSLDLVRKLFQDLPELLSALEAARTSSTILPDGRVVELSKYAPMGSALCFPVEATVFWLLLVGDLVVNGRMPLSVAARKVFVYGDDIVVPTEHASRAIQLLEMFALKVNKTKCCIQGFFRESCGMDAFNGAPVTPTRFKKLWSGRSSDAVAYNSYIELAQNLYDKGYKLASERIILEVALVYGPVPYTCGTSPGNSIRVSTVFEAMLLNAKLGLRMRWNSALSSFEVLARTTVPRRRATTLDGWPRLLCNMVTPGALKSDDVVLPYSTKIKKGWLRLSF